MLPPMTAPLRIEALAKSYGSRPALSGVSLAVKEEELRQADSAFNLAFLVDRDGLDAFGRGVSGLAKQFGERLELHYVGPLPPYSFADVELTGEAAWA